MILNAKTAAKLVSALFPNQSTDEGLVSLIDWLDEYANAHNGAINDTSTITKIETVAKNDGIIEQLLSYAKENSISAGDLAQKVGVSYPTMLNWQHGRSPRGKNLQKLRDFLDKVKN